MSVLKEYLEKHTAWLKEYGAPGTKDFKYRCIEDFVLQNGREFIPAELPSGYELGEKKECFTNAIHLAVQKDLVYVEGYCFQIIPFHHAWCVDRDGTLIEPTLEKPLDYEYFGVGFNSAWAMGHMMKRGYYGLLDDWENGWPILTGKVDPVLATGDNSL